MEWLNQPEKHDCKAADDYISLLGIDRIWENLASEHKSLQINHRKAKDILRASGLPLLPADNKHVAKDLQKITNGEKVSPIIVMPDKHTHRLIIADGYHRVCAVYHASEDEDIPCVGLK